MTGDGDQGNIVARQGLAEHLLAQTFPPHRVRLEVFQVLQQVAVLVGVAVRQVAGKVQYKERERKLIMQRGQRMCKLIIISPIPHQKSLANIFQVFN